MEPRPDKPRLTATTTLLAALYAGVLLGCSFLATSAKFLAPTLTLPVALDVGRHTFQVLLPVEWALAGVLLVLVWITCGRWRRGMVLAVVVALVLQTLWLRPLLDDRVAQIIAGEQPPPSIHHMLYAGCEGLKVLLLLGLAASLAWWGPRPSPGPAMDAARPAA